MTRLAITEQDKIDAFRKRFSESNFIMYIVANAVQTPGLLPVTEKFTRLVKRYLGINIRILGSLPYEPFMNSAITKRTPFVVEYPKSEYNNSMKKIAENLLAASGKKALYDDFNKS